MSPVEVEKQSRPPATVALTDPVEPSDRSPMLSYPFGTITIPQRSKDLVMQALEMGRVSCGNYVQEFERRYAQLVGTKAAVAVSSGTDALAIALSVLYDEGAERGDEVIVPALSFVATGHAVLHAGFTPVFVDVDRHTLNIRADRIEDKVTARTRAILPVHLMGKSAEMDTICAIAQRHKLLVVGDAAEAHAAQYQGRDIGTWGDLVCYSLYVAHITSTVEGGIITTDNEEYADRLLSLRVHGRHIDSERGVLKRADATQMLRIGDGKRDMRFSFERMGFSSRMNDLEAAVGLGNLEIYEEIVAKRRRNLRYLMDRFDVFSPYLYTITEEAHERLGPHAMPFIVSEEAPFTRDEFSRYLSQARIDPRDLFSSIPTQCRGYEFLGHKRGDFPDAEFIGTHGLHVGVHQDLSLEHLDYLLETTERFLKENT